MQLKIEATGHYLIHVLKDDQVRESVEFNNLITDIGLKDWMTQGIGNQLKLGIGRYDDTPVKNMETIPASITNIDLANVKDNIFTENTTNLIYRFIYERTCPAETSDKIYNTIATVLPSTNHLFSIAKIKNMDNEPLQLTVKQNERIKIIYELRLVVTKNIYTRPNVDIGFSGLSDIAIRIERGNNIKGGVSQFVTTLQDRAQVENDDGYEAVLERKNTHLESLPDRLRLGIEDRLLYTQQTDLTNIKAIVREFGLFKIITTLNPPIDRTQTTLDIVMACSIDIVKGAN